MSLMVKATTHAVRGPRREMEDCYAVCDAMSPAGLGLLMVVCDGSLGRQTAWTAINQFPLTFKRALLHATNPVSALRFALEVTADETMRMNPSATLSAVYITPDAGVAYACVLGDSPVLIYDQGGIKNIMPLHNVGSDDVERRAAIGRGAVYDNGYLLTESGHRAIQLSRCLGAADIASILSQDPEISAFALGEGSVIIVASDGVLLTKSTEQPTAECETLLDLAVAGADAKAIVDRALQLGTRDNATAIVWRY